MVRLTSRYRISASSQLSITPQSDGGRSRFLIGHWRRLSCIFCLIVIAAVQPSRASEPIKLDPENPHYFLFRSEPTILISAAEHYGALVNLDFDYIPYLNELHVHGFNLTQLFSGIMVEDDKSTKMGYDDCLAPRPGRLLIPWMRSSTPGYVNGGNKFDLSKFDPKYFSRLKNFVSEADKRGIVVEIQLFWNYYRSDIWDISPLNPRNNINGIGKGGRNSTYNLSDPAITMVQTAMLKKIVAELKDYDNVYYEVADGQVLDGTEAWSNRMIATIVQAEAGLPTPHLIAQTLFGRASSTNPAVSIYDIPGLLPGAVARNAQHPKVIAFDDVAHLGAADKAYRLQAWDKVLAGAGAFVVRDFSITPDYEAGGPTLAPGDYGGGGASLRNQLTVLKNFIYGLNFSKMIHDPSVVRRVPENATALVLDEPGRVYVIYVEPKQAQTTNYSVRWTGQIESPHSEMYTFYTRADDGVRLWINGHLLIDDWTTHPVKEDSAQIFLTGGHKYALKMEYFQGMAGAAAGLLWSSRRQAKQIIPSSQLFRPDGSGEGLKGDYYEDLDFHHLVMTRYDDEVNFNWDGGASPFAIADSTAEEQPYLLVDLPAGSYQAKWLETATGKIFDRHEFKHTGGAKKMDVPVYSEGVVLSLKRN
jgi:PA14 domain